jgi:hypothetical protein
MRADIERAMTKSAKALQEIVWPVMGPLVGGGRLIPVETVTSAGFTRELDLLAGIDAWQILSGQSMRGLASRVQFGERAWNTFTVRSSLKSGYDTELQKRIRWADHGWEKGLLGPHLTCHAYVAERSGPDQLVSAAIARTRDIIAAIRCGYSYRRANGADGNVFECVDWSVLEEQGAVMCRWPEPAPRLWEDG